MAKKNGEIDLKDIFHAFLHSAWLIIVCALILGLLMGLYSTFLKKETYSSKTTLMVSKDNKTVDSNDIVLASKMIETYKVIIYSDSFLDSVIEDINTNPKYKNNKWNLNTKHLGSMFQVNQCGETEVFNVVVTTEDATLSYALADTLAKRITDSLPDILPYPEGVIVTSIVDPAKFPEAANSKNTVRNVVLGGLIGAILAMVIIFFRWYNDVTIRTRKDLEENLNLLVLGEIPKYEVVE